MATKTSKGSIIQLEKGRPKGKCRKWRLVVSLGRDPETGKYPQKARTFHGTFTEAQKALREFSDEIANGRVVRKNTWTVNEYIEHFMAERKESGEYARRTLGCNQRSLDAVAHLIGAMNIQDVNIKVVESMYKDMRTGKTLSGKPMCGSTIHRVSKIFSMMMDRAVEERIIGANPCNNAVTPRPDTKEKEALTAEQMKDLISSLDATDPMQCAIIICATLGLRRSEVVALSWRDVDLGGGLLHVRHSCEDNGELKEPKTNAGKRTLPLPEQTREALAELRQAEIERIAHGAKIDPSEVTLSDDAPVICNAYGKRALPGVLGYWWRNHRKDYGLEGYNLHGLRHSFLSLAAAQGVHPSVMQKLAGHSTPTVTMQIYTHVNMDAQRNAIDAIQNALAS